MLPGPYHGDSKLFRVDLSYSKSHTTCQLLTVFIQWSVVDWYLRFLV